MNYILKFYEITLILSYRRLLDAQKSAYLLVLQKLK